MGPIQQSFNQGLSVASLLYTQTSGFKTRQETRLEQRQVKDLEARQQNYLQKYGKDVGYIHPETDKRMTGKQLMTEDEYISTLKDKTPEQVASYRKLYKNDIGEFNKYEEQLSNINSSLYAKGKIKDNQATGTYERAMINAQQGLETAQEEKRQSKPIDYREKIWNYDIDYKPGLDQAYNKVKNIVEEK